MSEFRSEGLAQITPPYIPVKDGLGKAWSPLARPTTQTLPPSTRSHSIQNQPDPALLSTPAALLAATTLLCDGIAARPNQGETTLPREDLKRLAALGLLLAPFPAAHGGLGLGTEPAGNLPLLRILAALGGADLVLGRLYEGHVNALIFIAAYGTPQQLARAAQDCREGRWFGVWNTGPKEPLRLEPASTSGSFTLVGAKNFASGAEFIQRPIVTAQRKDGAWIMTLPRMESPDVAPYLRFDRDFWHPLGMAASESYAVDFTGACLTQDDLIGGPGDIFLDPLFFGGTIRFAAVQAGAILRLHRLFAEWLDRGGRGSDPYQIARLGEITLAAQEAVLWIERAAAVASQCLFPRANSGAIQRMHHIADLTRLAIERIATATMPRVVAGVGAHGLIRPSRFERILRDLTMYLRQPVPDYCLAAVGRNALRRAALRPHCANHVFWSEPMSDESLPPAYFQRLYDRSRDPWNFETSPYEAAKYRETLASLPRAMYANALEVGCSIGVLTQQLAGRCQALLSLDVSETALGIARDRCKLLPNVRFLRMEVPREEPTGLFDLVVISEVAYYWQREDLDRAIAIFAAHQAPGAHLLLVHHTPYVPDYPLTGDQVHEAWLARPEWRVLEQQRHEGYRLDLLERT